MLKPPQKAVLCDTANFDIYLISKFGLGLVLPMTMRPNNASKPIKAVYPGERSMSVTVCLEIREGDPKADTVDNGTYFYALAFNTL